MDGTSALWRGTTYCTMSCDQFQFAAKANAQLSSDPPPPNCGAVTNPSYQLQCRQLVKAHVRDHFSLPQTGVHVAATRTSSGGRALVSVKRCRYGGSSQREAYPSLLFVTTWLPGATALGLIDSSRVVQVVRDETLAVFVDARQRSSQRLPKRVEKCASRVRRGECAGGIYWPVPTLNECRIANPPQTAWFRDVCTDAN